MYRRRLPLPPVLVEPAFDDPQAVLDLIERAGPAWPVQRYYLNQSPRAAQGSDEGEWIDQPTAVAFDVLPVFRQDWHFRGEGIDGVEPVLHHGRFVEGARTIFGADAIVVPEQVYSNLTAPMPRQPSSHTDVPEFRGVDRTNTPQGLLQAMGHSGLFADHQITIATAVAWLYGGEGGGFSYWPEGPDGPRRVQDDLWNTAVVGDNDYMFHRVEAIGDQQAPPMTLDTHLELGDDRKWHLTRRGDEVATFGFDEIRTSISWKAKVYPDAEAQRIADEHLDDLTRDEVVERFRVDFADRGEDLPAAGGDDPVADPAFVSALTAAYITSATTE